MWKLWLLFSFLGVSLARGGPQGMEPTGNRIVGGVPIDITEVPWQVALDVRGFLCGGSIISPSCILTAAHCLFGFSTESVRTRSGSNIYNSGGTVTPASQLFTFQGYNGISGDVGVIRLQDSLVFDDTMQAIQLTNEEPRNRSEAMASGWGVTTENGTVSETLLGVTVNIISREECRNSYNAANITIDETMICAAAPGRDSCQGDSGGPLAQDGVLVGVVSFGIGCAREDFQGVYVNVANPDIRAFISASCPDLEN